VERYVSEHPSDRARVHTQLSPGLMEALLDGVIELALCALARAEPRADILWTYSAPLLLVAAASHPLARAGSCARADLARHTILTTQAGPTRLGLSRIAPIGVEARIEATAGEVMRQLLMRGVGISVLPAIAVWDELKRGDLVSVALLDAELPTYDIALVSWQGRALSPAAEALVEMARGVAMQNLLG
jgi:DNA-binding transcriptional LysR family regulator